MLLTLTAFSTALYSTWVFVDEFDLLFDAGDGISALLGQRSGKIRHIFLSHADRDHLTGLIQLHQLNAHAGTPAIHYPRDSGSFPALAGFLSRFDPNSGPATWRGLDTGSRVEIGPKRFVLSVRNDHQHAPPGIIRSLSYLVVEERTRLRPEFSGLSGEEIAALREREGDELVVETVEDKLLGYSGDTPVHDFEHWRGVHTLIHEATFLEGEGSELNAGHEGQHSSVPGVLRMAAEIQPRELVLIHFSARYHDDEIRARIHCEAEKFDLPFPVFAVFPGRVSVDILRGDPVWKGR